MWAFNYIIIFSEKNQLPWWERTRDCWVSILPPPPNNYSFFLEWDQKELIEDKSETIQASDNVKRRFKSVPPISLRVYLKAGEEPIENERTLDI